MKRGKGSRKVREMGRKRVEDGKKKTKIKARKDRRHNTKEGKKKKDKEGD